MYRLVLVLALLFCVSPVSLASSIELSTETPEVEPRSVVTLKATPDSDNAKEFVLYGPDGFVQTRNVAPFEWTLNISKKYHGIRLYQVIGVVDGRAVQSNDLNLMVKPDLSKMRKMVFEPFHIDLYVGMEVGVQLTGYFPRGLKYDVGRWGWVDIKEVDVFGFNEIEGDSPNIEILSNGRFKAIREGEAGLYAEYNGRRAQFRFSIYKKPEEKKSADFELANEKIE